MEHWQIHRKALIGCILLMCAHVSIEAHIHFRHLGVKDGLSQTTVKSIYQDELGRMWFGTLEGINLFDGTQIKAFKPPFFRERGIKMGNQVDYITGDRNGSVFFTADKMLFRYDIRQDVLVDFHKDNISYLGDSHGTVWMAASDSIFRWNKDKLDFEWVYTIQPDMGKNVLSFCCDTSQRLWIGTARGLFVMEKKESAPVCIIPKKSIRYLYEDSRQNIWVSPHRNGMYKISGVTLDTLHYTHKKEINSLYDVRQLTEDDSGNLWIGTYQGINKLDKEGGFSVYSKSYLPGSLKHASVFATYKDDQGTIWVGTYYGGVHYYNPEIDVFEYYAESQKQEDGLSYSFVGSMLEDKKQNIWICTEGGGLNSFDRKTRKFTHYPSTAIFPFNNLKCIAYQEEKDKLYMGTYTTGLFSFDIATQRIEQVFDTNKYGRVVTDVELYHSSLLFLSEKGLFSCNLQNGETVPVFQSSYFRGVRFTIDAKGYIWIIGLHEVFRINLANKEEAYVYKVGEKGLGDFTVTNIVEDKQGNIFLGTGGSGLYRFEEKTGTFTGYTTKDNSLVSDYCYSMAFDKEDTLVITTDKGVIFWDTKKCRIIRSIEIEQLLFSGINEDNGLLVCSNGEVFVGGIDGLTVFDENKVKQSKSYNLYFSSLHVNNKVIRSGQSGILEESIAFVQCLHLAYNQNNIVIDFASNNYIGDFNNIEYEYKLKGFDKEWITTQTKNIVYTNLNPGSYQLMVREKPFNTESAENPHTIEMQIVIHRPWFASWPAFAVYFVCMGLILYFIYQNRKSKLQLRLSLENERREKEKNEEIAQEKLRFFANVSHELRTPLTLIISQIEFLIHSCNLPSTVNQRLGRIHKNTFQLRELISELLDFRKLERGGICLKVREFDIVSLLQGVVKTFAEQAALKRIDIEFRSSAGQILYWGDVAQMRKVFNNLLSNAIKYSPEERGITVQIDQNAESILIKVIDSGMGIEPESVPKVFDRFYQSENTSNTHIQGTGIGLSLTKGLVELHHGSIEVQSELGYGSIFTIVLKKGNKHFEGDTKVIIKQDAQQPEEVPSIPDYSFKEDAEIYENISIPEPGVEQKPRILIVEDNEELLQLLSELFSPIYHVIIALNGKEGLEKAYEEKPDLIVSDIMMPVMTGTEMCMKIKNRFELCHIPVVLLTALASSEKNLEGLQCGADDYISKPFDVKLLLARCTNLIRNRALLHQKYVSGEYDSEPQNNLRELTTNTIDQKFLAQLNESVEKHLTDAEFSINTLAKEVGVSRSSLYGKVKALCGVTPNEFILNMKLQRAASILKTNEELQITEIAYMLGFNSVRYFRSVFKIRYGKTPQEFRNEETKKKG